MHNVVYYWAVTSSLVSNIGQIALLWYLARLSTRIGDRSLRWGYESVKWLYLVLLPVALYFAVVNYRLIYAGTWPPSSLEAPGRSLRAASFRLGLLVSLILVALYSRLYLRLRRITAQLDGQPASGAGIAEIGWLVVFVGLAAISVVAVMVSGIQWLIEHRVVIPF